MKKLIFVGIALFVIVGVFLLVSRDSDNTVDQSIVQTPVNVPDGLEVATFAAGCFWCTEAVFQEQPGVEDVISGYVGG